MGNRKSKPTASTALLTEMVDKLGLQEVVRQIGYKKTTVCHVLRGTYKGSPAAVIQAAEEAYSRDVVTCPILGDISLSQCVQERKRPFAAINPLRVKLARTCPVCEGGGKGPRRGKSGKGEE